MLRFSQFSLLMSSVVMAIVIVSCGDSKPDSSNTLAEKPKAETKIDLEGAVPNGLALLDSSQLSAEGSENKTPNNAEAAEMKPAETNKKPAQNNKAKAETVKKEVPKKQTKKASNPVQKAVKNDPPAKKPVPKKVVKVDVPKPAIVFKERTFDFGEIYEGDEIEHKFLFKNVGDAPLEILDAQVTCGCTHPSFPFLAIPPGETGFIGVSYISVGKFGVQEPKITIKSNATTQSIDLVLKGFVKKKEKVEEDDKNIKTKAASAIDSTKIKSVKLDTSSLESKNGK